MVSLRCIAALALAVLFMVPPVQAGDDGAGEREGGAGPRTEWVQQNPSEIELKANGTAYSNAAFRVPVPANATVTTASMDLQGKLIKGNLTFKSADYAETGAGHKAYKGQVTDFDRARTTLKSLLQGEFGSGDYSSVSASDDNYVSQAGDFSGNVDGYELFRLKVPIDVSAEVTVTWEGQAGSYYGASEYSLWIWNNASELWETIETGTVSVDKVVARIFTGDWYIENRSVCVLAMCTDGYDIYTDYVNVSVSGYPNNFPVNLTLDIGGNGKMDWSLPGERFDYTIHVEEMAIATELQELALGSATQYANISFLFRSESAGKVRISGLRFNFTAPPWCKGIPDNLTLQEDSVAARLVDLNAYFSDDAAGLLYQISYQQDAKKLKAELEEGRYLTFRTMAKNWWGKMRFKVTATDSDAYTTDSNNFTVTVEPVNDPPSVLPIQDQRVTEKETLSFQAKFRDVDTDLDKTETVTFSIDNKLLAIDPPSGWINYTGRQADVGSYYITVTVTDRGGLTGTGSFNFTVEDVEDPPVMKPIPDLSAAEEELFTYQVNATDPDLPYGDSLAFSDDTTLFDIDPDTGFISFLPHTKDIGLYKITITAKDSHAKFDKRAFNLSVKNYIGTLDKPPTLEKIPDLTAVEGEPFTYAVNASDPDLDNGDVLAFSDNTGIFNIGPANGTIFFVPTSLNIGTHKITITVSDQDDLRATASFKLSVLKKNSPPVITAMKPKNGATVLVDHEVFLSAEATDAENDQLTYTWKEGDTVLGTGTGILATFNTTGLHVITLAISDGRAETVNTTTIKVVKTLPNTKTPGFGTALLLLAVLGALACAALARRRR